MLDMTHLLIKGMIVGFLIAAPVGPVGILCVKRTLVTGFLSGIFSGLGAASADTIFAAIAGFGITAIAALIESKKHMLEIIGGIILIIVAIKSVMTKKNIQENDNDTPIIVRSKFAFVGDYFSSFFLTITNPITIIAVGALLASLGAIQVSGNYIATATLVLGVFLGSALWFTGLVTVVGFLLHKKLTIESMYYVHKIAGVIFFIFGISILIHSIFYT